MQIATAAEQGRSGTSGRAQDYGRGTRVAVDMVWDTANLFHPPPIQNKQGVGTRVAMPCATISFRENGEFRIPPREFRMPIQRLTVPLGGWRHKRTPKPEERGEGNPSLGKRHVS